MHNHGGKVLITGGAGFIGSHLARALSQSGWQVRVLDDLSTGKRERLAAIHGVELLHADVRNPAAVQRAMQDVHAAVHLAGVHPGVDALRAQEINVGGALHLLNFARDAGKRTRPRVILCGSGSVYGNQSSMVLHEELQPRPMTPESVMALALEHYGRIYRETFAVPVVTLRLFRVFGPEEDAERPDTGPVARFIRAALDGKAPVLFGDGQQTRDFVYIDNVVAALIAALGVADPSPEPVNVASGEAVAVSFLWSQILELSGKKRAAIAPNYVPAPPWDARHSRPQIAKACKLLGWAPAVRLREGVQLTVDYYRALRNVDPNAWFAPRLDKPARPAPPPLPQATRRFGSVVSPASGILLRSAKASSAAPPRPLPAPTPRRPPPTRPSAPPPSPAKTSAPPSSPTKASAPPSSPAKTAMPRPSTAALPSAPPPPPRRAAEETLTVDEAEIVEESSVTLAAADLDLEWAPVPALPGLGR